MKKIIGCVIMLISVVTQAAKIDLTQEEKNYIENKKGITIAILTTDQSPYVNINDMGDFSGIHIDYIRSITESLGFDVKYHGFKSVKELLLNVKLNKSDIAIGFSKTASRQNDFVFSKNFFEGNIATWYRKPKAKYLPIQELSWVCVTNTIYCERLEREGVTNIIEVDDFANAIDLVNDGYVDAVIANYVKITKFLNEKNVVVGETSLPKWLEPEEAGVITAKKNKMLINIINKILTVNRNEIISYSYNSKDIYHQSDLLNLAYRKMNVEDQVIKYSASEDSYPLFYRNNNGKLTGYLFDFIKLIQARTGLKFKYIKNTGNTAFKDLSKGNIDLIPIAFSDVRYDKNITLSNPYVSIVYKSIEKKEYTGKSKTTGVLVSSNDTKNDFMRSILSKKMISYNEIQKLLIDLELGIISRAYLPDDILQGVIAKDFTDRFVVGKKKDMIVDLSFAVSKNNRILSDVINAVLDTVDDEEFKKLKRGYRQFNVTYGYDKSRVDKMILLFACAVILSFMVLYFWLKNLKLQITLKRKDTKQLESKKEWLQSIIEEQPSVIFIHSENNEVSLSNCDLYRYGKCKNCLFFFGDNKKYYDEHNKIIHGNIVINDTMHSSNHCKLGYTEVERVRKKITGQKSNINYILTVINDISEKKRQEKKLVEANEVAQIAIASRERFLASMSHELRTPIAGVMGLLELLSSRVEGTEKQSIVENISSSMHHLHLLVNDILDFSKLEAKQLSLEKRECYYLFELGNLFRLHNASAIEKGIRFYLNIEPSSIEVIEVDSLRLSQIVNNILSNAIKFTSKGYVEINMNLTDESLFINVIDTGLGMTEVQLKSVFKPFTQADNTIAREYGGTGLGLNIVHELIKLMKGKLKISSTKNIGTNINIEIPINVISTFKKDILNVDINVTLEYGDIPKWISKWKDDNNSSVYNKKKIFISENINDSKINIEVNDDDLSQKNESFWTINSSPLFIDELYSILNKITRGDLNVDDKPLDILSGFVLVAEDNKINQTLLVKQLNEIGVKSVVTNNGEEAYNELVNNPNKYDLLITDCHMPILDGFALAKKIRKEVKEFNDKPIVGCTAEDSRVSRLNGSNYGIDYMVFKPYSIKQLHTILKPYLGNVNNQKDENISLYNDCFLTDKLSELYSEGLIDLFIESMNEDVELLISVESENDINELLHRIKGGMGSVGFDDVVILINNLSDKKFGSIEYLKEREDLILKIRSMISEAYLWKNIKND